MKRTVKNLLNYLGTNENLIRKWLREHYRAIFVGALILIFALIAIFALAIVVRLGFVLLTISYGMEFSKESSVRDITLAIAAIIGAPFVIWRTYIADKQTHIADLSLFNDKINAAGENLASLRDVKKLDGKTFTQDDLVKRMIAMDHLEVLARERPDQSPRIVRMLAAYVRANFPCQSLEPTEDLKTRNTPRMDLQKAIDVMGSIHKLARVADPSHWRLDLKECDLDGVNFTNGYFYAADFTRSRMEAAYLRKANLRGTQFRLCMLNHTIFFDTDLTGSCFADTKILIAGPFGPFARANIKGIDFSSADLSGVRKIGKVENITATFGTRNTILSKNQKNSKPSDQDFETYHLFKDDDKRGDYLEIIERVEKSGFQNWSPYNHDDLANAQIQEELYEKLGLLSWPYWEE